MLVLVLGLVLFLGVHSVRIPADAWRAERIARMGPNGWKVAYSLLSVLGLVLIIWGYGLTRQDPIDLWDPPRGTRHAASLLVLLAFVLLAATYVPGNRIKAAVHHPMVLSVKVWAFAHLISNGRLADLVLFGAFLVWAIVLYAASRQRDRRNGIAFAPAGGWSRDAITVVAGGVGWYVFAFHLHGAWIGVSPFG
jgi:uncharacterized membrane protein